MEFAMSRQLFSAAALVCVFGFASPMWVAAQQPATPPAQTPATTPANGTQPGEAPAASPQTGSSDDSSFKIVTSVNEVNLIFTVTDKHGNFIPNLKQSDFALLDDQKAPARISSFTQQTNLPLRVGIVIDASTSIRSRFQFEQQAATEFLLQAVKSRSDRAFVMGFDSTPTVYTACRDKLLDISRGQEPVRRAMVLVSDGNDNQSRAYIDDAIKMCQRSETIIYAISTNWTPSRGRGDDVLEKMARATGGRAFFPPSVDEMALGFNSIEEELRSQYALTYTPADFKADGAFRTIYLFANDRRYQVRTRQGYFSPKQ
jgi:hypothetical protein